VSDGLPRPQRDADLGDSRCTVDLDSPAYKGNGTVDGVSSGHVFSASGLDGFADGWFIGGKLVWTSGGNEGAAIEVKTHVNSGAEVSFELWESMAFDIATGDTFTVTAGCDKSLDTCMARFNNVANFRGFPFIPGNDAVVARSVLPARQHRGRRALRLVLRIGR
jgi:uncharacterized phage protein (TIGR02218 family)